ncbi:transcription factor kayak isoform X2 [Drosophila bipectinata]|uniref:transcription factor kayak isoform X2 n=1 Tax=Drosophila bipectinata TaxID=42026 RepID=UPI0038B3256C
MIAIKAIEMQQNNGWNHTLQQQQQQQVIDALLDNPRIWLNNNNNNSSNNATPMQLQVQQQQQHQQQQPRAAAWITENNKPRHINNNNIMNVNYNQHLAPQQQQEQPVQQLQYMQPTYSIYTQHQPTVPATTSNSCLFSCNVQQTNQYFANPTTTTATTQHQQHQGQQTHQAHHQLQQRVPQDYLGSHNGIDQQQARHLGTFDGIQLAPTLTTPTLTPTTTRSLQEAFFELTNDPVSTPYQATFKPPPLGLMPGGNTGNGVVNAPTTTATATLVGVVNPMISQIPFEVNSGLQGTDSDNSNGSWADGQNNEDQDTTDTSSAHTDSTSYQNGMVGSSVNGGGANNFTNVLAGIAGRGSSQASNTNTSNSATPARRGGGRRPNRNANMTPEEEQKRAIRRERNKQAAARCRKRRVDQTNELTYEVEQLEKKGEGLKKEVESLTEVKNQLEFFLRAHHSSCQKIRTDLLSVTTCNGLIAPVGLPSAGSCDSGASSHHNNNSNDSSNGTITGLDATLNSTGRSNSPLDLKPQIKDEPLDGGLDSSCLLDQDGPPPSKRFALPPMSTLMTPTGVSSGSLQTPIVSTAPVGFGSAYPITTPKGSMNSPTLNELNKPKERPTTLPVQRPFVPQMHLNLTSNHNKMPGSGPTHIQGVPIQTPTTGFNFDSLMDGGTGLTPVSGPLVPSQNKHPLELPTPTAEPSKLVSL